jgi:glycosyltransferase involved in cell wall biosynthesis
MTILYVVLDAARVNAAVSHVTRLAGEGAQVHLVAIENAAWTQLPTDNVTRHIVPKGKPKAVRAAATKMVLGLLADCDLLVPGDPFALPVAWSAMRSRPDLTVQLEPAPDPARRTAEADLAVVTPWFPSPNNPLAGAFVKASTDAVKGQYDRISIIHSEDWPVPWQSSSAELILAARRRLQEREPQLSVWDDTEGELTRVPVPLSSKREYATWALEHVEAVRAALPDGVIKAPLIHAHTGIYGGVVAARLADPSARLIVSEHSSFLPNVFKQSDASQLYEEVLARAEAVLCVSRYLYEQIKDKFPQHHHKLRQVPNVVDFDHFQPRPQPVTDLLRWLYVGRLSEPKGVNLVLEAFALIAPEEPRATLTIVGGGPLEPKLRTRIQELGLGDRVEIRPSVRPSKVAGIMHSHDLLVHGSKFETFGLTVVEAVATQMPVLVTRSPGPEETLAGLEGIAGMLVEESPDPEVIADGYRELRKRVAKFDLPAARAKMLSRYGREAVTAKLAAVYAGQPPVLDERRIPEPDAERVVVIGIMPSSYRSTTAYIRSLLDAGFQVDLVTAKTTSWELMGLDDRVHRHEILEAEERMLLSRLEKAVLVTAPDKVVGSLRSGARRQRSVDLEARTEKVNRQLMRVADALHNRIYGRAYVIIRPRLLWRVFRRDVLPNLDLTRTRRVVVAGLGGVTIGWKLGRMVPGMTVTTAQDPLELAPREAEPAAAEKVAL